MITKNIIFGVAIQPGFFVPQRHQATKFHKENHYCILCYPMQHTVISLAQQNEEIAFWIHRLDRTNNFSELSP